MLQHHTQLVLEQIRVKEAEKTHWPQSFNFVVVTVIKELYHSNRVLLSGLG